MKTKRISTPSAEGKLMLESLRQAVGKTLEKKRRLGQYSVTWKDGKPVISGEQNAWASNHHCSSCHSGHAASTRVCQPAPLSNLKGSGKAVRAAF